ncbi:1-(5-phosphoribosyl)-5-[(5-phosphoribosylamino)methylideneamino]imidazole-4-carboxamide isomerase [soil metagenome]
MELIAAMDLLGGRARRLLQGDYGRPLEASADPLTLARGWLTAGVPRLHIVDLDGARNGRPVHARLVEQICRLRAEIAPQVRVQSGGGLRDEDSVAALIEAGVDEVILGSAAVVDPEFLGRCASRWPGRVGAALDLRQGRVAVAGWTEEVATDAHLLAERLLSAGAARLLVTDIARDGMAAGPNLELMAEFRERHPRAVLVCAGGVTTAVDLAALASIGVDGAVVGRALLDGSLDIGRALAACESGVPA